MLRAITPAVAPVVAAALTMTQFVVAQEQTAAPLANERELRALVWSEDQYPQVDRKRVGRLAVPTLLLSGERSHITCRLVDDELERLLPRHLSRRVVLPGATHGMWHEQPAECRKHVLEFIRIGDAVGTERE